MSAETFYYFLFGIIAAVCSLIEYGNYKHSSSGEKTKELSSTFLTFRNNYLTVYALMMAGDWLQGMDWERTLRKVPGGRTLFFFVYASVPFVA